MWRHRWEIALVGVAAVWGSTFVLVQDAVEVAPPFLFLALRFSVAALALAAAGGFRHLARADVSAGAAIGLALFAGYAFQTVGLQYTSASNAGFVTGLFVILTPLMGAAIFRRLPSAAAGAGALLATVGLALLATPSGLALRRGDALVLLCAVSFAAHILLIAHLGRGRSPLRLAAVQTSITAVLSATWTLGAERAPLPQSGTVWLAVVLTGILATAVAFGVQTAAQRHVPPTRTAVILAAEPAFAGLFGFLLAGDRLGASGYAGAGMILAGIVIVELGARPEEEMEERI